MIAPLYSTNFFNQNVIKFVGMVRNDERRKGWEIAVEFQGLKMAFFKRKKA
jgi:hypothetical protein